MILAHPVTENASKQIRLPIEFATPLDLRIIFNVARLNKICDFVPDVGSDVWTAPRPGEGALQIRELLDARDIEARVFFLGGRLWSCG